MSDTYTPTGQILEQYWFLKDGETGLHAFSRLAYHSKTTPFLRNLQEFRTLFRPNSNIWTHLATNGLQYAPLPSKKAQGSQVVVQGEELLEFTLNSPISLEAGTNDVSGAPRHHYMPYSRIRRPHFRKILTRARYRCYLVLG